MKRQYIILQGDAIKRLRELPDESVHCCVTSPPYWGLRDYQTGAWEGGDSECEHSCGGQVQDTKAPGAITSGVRPGCNASVCKKCGAVRIDNQLGLEITPEEYINKMVEVFREVRRVLRSDGTLWLNIGDSYCASATGSNSQEPSRLQGGKNTQIEASKRPSKLVAGLKPKDLVGIPWMLAFALRADGWWLRQDIIWHKPNPMPESVTDRCTKSHEYVFLLTKSARYYYDAESIKEPTVTNDGNVRDRETTRLNNSPGRKRMEGLTTNNYEMRNKRSVWSVTTTPYAEAHFATFPTDLIEPCILAGTSQEGCCDQCGAPWIREVEKISATSKECPKTVAAHKARGGTGTPVGTVGKSGSGRINGSVTTVGWSPSCDCGLEPTPCTVLYPFSGAGTTALVAVRHNRKAIGIELNPEYVAMSEKRIYEDAPLFAGSGA